MSNVKIRRRSRPLAKKNPKKVQKEELSNTSKTFNKIIDTAREILSELREDERDFVFFSEEDDWSIFFYDQDSSDEEESYTEFVRHKYSQYLDVFRLATIGMLFECDEDLTYNLDFHELLAYLEEHDLTIKIVPQNNKGLVNVEFLDVGILDLPTSLITETETKGVSSVYYSLPMVLNSVGERITSPKYGRLATSSVIGMLLTSLKPGDFVEIRWNEIKTAEDSLLFDFKNKFKRTKQRLVNPYEVRRI